ncbi:MAG TPA: 4'-phosphopantetheinyl transferase superfamily protein [Pyrinomonadaceae bacterium]|nr:4'-phosphopantetheinyl transferase superfamily protein [Pyrinomonadaceae bacterium]
MQELTTQIESQLSDDKHNLVPLAPHWARGPLTPTLGENETHIWKIDLRCESTGEMNASLSPDEHDRAARFHFERDRQRFRIARASLRMILSRYLNLAPEDLVFATTEYGKPFLTNPQAAGLIFNLSHSQDFALLAVTREREVGIDIEFMRSDFATSDVAEHFFSVAEVYTFSGLDPDLRTLAFFNCWTRKEAYIKARGEGLSMPLDSFDVSLTPGLPVALLQNRLDPADVSRWSLHELSPAPSYAAAIAVERCDGAVSFQHFVLAE